MVVSWGNKVKMQPKSTLTWRAVMRPLLILLANVGLFVIVAGNILSPAMVAALFVVPTVAGAAIAVVIAIGNKLD
jgi:hypothetical protein